jgi:heme oxygenase-like protein
MPGFQGVDVLADDAQLALWTCYELHYSGFDGVADEWEWDPSLLAVRRELEQRFVRRIADEIGPIPPIAAAELAPALLDLAAGDGPSLSGFLYERGTRLQMREFLIHRSIYQRKEADPHTWAIPRMRGRAKAAMVTIQNDEYGDGVTEAMHAELFATTMRAFGLDPALGAYIDVVPGTTLATDNLVSMFGLHRAWRAACVGHLALFEMTSVGPMGRYAKALARFGVPAPARLFYEVHVTADEVHQHVALDDMVGGLVEAEPHLGREVLFGARALAEIEGRFSAHLLDRWDVGASSLLQEPMPQQLAS